MNNKRDIQNRQDVEMLLKAFYQKAFADELIGVFFTTIVPLDLNTHLPHITDFWMSILFSTTHYTRNVMEVHTRINTLMPINKKHSDRWLQLFTATIDDFFVGEKALLAKQRAHSVATIMNIKLTNNNQINKL